jgi:Raf kinase inhibitor-like YbhB/YbcL family protein
VQLTNDFSRVGWGGPCPPPGKVHNYNFKLYALDTKLNLDESAAKSDVENAMQGHVIAETVLIGTYERLG